MPILPLLLPILIVAVLLADIFFFVSGIVSFLHGAPFVVLSRDKIRNALRRYGLSENDVFCDLGCGDGRTLLIAAEEFKAKKAVGWEIGSFPFILAKIAIASSKAKGKMEIHNGDLFSADISKATFIYAYLASGMADRIADKIVKEVATGTKVVCPAFPIDTKRRSQFSLIGSERFDNTTVYCYQIK